MAPGAVIELSSRKRGSEPQGPRRKRSKSSSENSIVAVVIPKPPPARPVTLPVAMEFCQRFISVLHSAVTAADNLQSLAMSALVDPLLKKWGVCFDTVIEFAEYEGVLEQFCMRFSDDIVEGMTEYPPANVTRSGEMKTRLIEEMERGANVGRGDSTEPVVFATADMLLCCGSLTPSKYLTQFRAPLHRCSGAFVHLMWSRQWGPAFERFRRAFGVMLGLYDTACRGSDPYGIYSMPPGEINEWLGFDATFHLMF